MDINTANIIILTYALCLFLYCMYLYRVNAFNMNAEPLTHQHLFWAALFIPISAFLVTGLICWHNYKFQINAQGFDNFLNISKLPLALLSLSLPFGVVINNIHRTIQTDKQIKEAERKSKSDSFQSHRKNTMEMLGSLPLSHIPIGGESVKLQFENNYVTYKACYPSASSTSNVFVADKRFISRLDIHWINLNALIKSPKYENIDEFYNYITSIEDTLHKIHTAFRFKPVGLLNWNCDYYTDHNLKECTFTSLFRNEVQIKQAIRSYWSAYITIAQALEITLSPVLITELKFIKIYYMGDTKVLGAWEASKMTAATRFGISKKQAS